MPFELSSEACLLVLDTCGERASLALFRGEQLLEEQVLAERVASAAILGVLRSSLDRNALKLRDLEAVGVVSGPGSFTGVRIGLALAKGFCESMNIPLAAVSRLAVLAEAAGLEYRALERGFALLGAGRDQVYAREVHPEAASEEVLANLMALEPMLAEADVAVVSSELATRLTGHAREVRLVDLSARHAIRAVRCSLNAGGSDLAHVDANYVRNEEAIYSQTGYARAGSSRKLERLGGAANVS